MPAYMVVNKLWKDLQQPITAALISGGKQINGFKKNDSTYKRKYQRKLFLFPCCLFHFFVLILAGGWVERLEQGGSDGRSPCSQL